MTQSQTSRRAQTVTLSELEQPGSQWSLRGKLPFYVLRRSAKREVFFKREDLESLHPSLPALLDLLFATYTDESIAATVAASLRLWRNTPAVQIPSPWFKRRYYDRISDVLDIDQESRSIRLMGDTVVVADESSITFAKPVESGRAHVISFEHLDEQFPGSRARLEAAWALNLSSEEMVAFIFSETVQLAVDLPEDISPT